MADSPLVAAALVAAKPPDSGASSGRLTDGDGLVKGIPGLA